MRQAHIEITLATDGVGLYEFTDAVRAFLKETQIEAGQMTIFCRHTSASLIIQENADPDVQRDLIAFFKRLVPDGDPLFVHTMEGPDDMPAHVKGALTQTSIAIPIMRSVLALGTWQGVYLFEHRRHIHARKIVMHVLGV